MVELAPTDSDEWLVRTTRNEISGPFSRQALIDKIQSGQLGPDDEVCQANHYWIYLDERDEVMRQLGIQLPGISSREEDEITDTQTDARTEEIVYRPQGGQAAEGADLPELSGEMEENTAVLSNRALREFQGRSAGKVSHQRAVFAPAPKPFVLGSVERPSVLRWIMSILVAIIIALVALVAYVLHQGK